MERRKIVLQGKAAGMRVRAASSQASLTNIQTRLKNQAQQISPLNYLYEHHSLSRCQRSLPLRQ